MSAAIARECKECAAVFELSVDEQEWFASRGFHLPKRCFECRRARRIQTIAIVVRTKVTSGARGT